MAGRGSEATRKGEATIGHWLVGSRGYGRFTPRSHDWVAATYGVGLSYLDTGLVTGTAHAGVAVSAINDYVTPFAQLGFAGALPLVRGAPFGDEDRGIHPPRARKGTYPRRDLYFCFDGGIIGDIDDSGESRFSVDLAFAGAVVGDELVIGLSAAGAHRRDAR
ncbi:MAG: hypothetical protein ABI867_44690 [Kofleriaceae bacterium]